MATLAIESTVMDRLVVVGGTPLRGTVRIGGAKNSALKLMAAALLAQGRTVLEDVPRILDVQTMDEVLEHLGASVQWDGSAVSIDTTGANGVDTPYELACRAGATSGRGRSISI